MKKILSFRLFFYLLYGLVLTAVLLYVRFPREKFRHYCERQVERTLSNVHCNIGHIGYSFPSSVIFEKVKLSSSATVKSRGFLVDRLQVEPRLQSLFFKWRVSGDLYGGTLGADLSLSYGNKSFILKNIQCQKIAIAEIVEGVVPVERKVTGSLFIDGEYKAGFNLPTAGTGNGHVRFEKGTFQLLNTLFTLHSLDYQTVQWRWQYGREKFDITDGKMLGKQFNVDFTGALFPRFLIDGGDLKLSGLITSNEAFLQGKPKIRKIFIQLTQRSGKAAVPFQLGGTLRKPRLRLIR